MRWYTYVGMKYIFPTGRWGSFFGYMGMLGVALGVMVLLVSQSVINGIGDSVRTPVRATQGDLQIRSLEGSALKEPYAIMDWLRQEFPEIQGQSAFAWGPVMLAFGEQMRFPFAWGLDEAAGNPAIVVEPYVQSRLGQGPLRDDELWVSSSLATSMGLLLGDAVTLYTPLMLEGLKNDPQQDAECLLPREFTVAGIFSTGWTQMDRNTLICTLSVFQELYALSDAVHGIALRLGPKVAIKKLMDRIHSGLLEQGFVAEVLAWTDLAYDLLALLDTEKRVLLFIMLFIILVAAFSIAVALMLTAVKKTRDIGLFMALGASRLSVGLLFCFQGFFLGLVGGLIGLAGALGAIHYRQALIQGLAKLLNNPNIMKIYGVHGLIPAKVLTSDLLLTLGFALLVSSLAGLLPALHSAKVQPGEALRLE